MSARGLTPPVAVVPGDRIGPEIYEAAVGVVRAALDDARPATFEALGAGARCHRRAGAPADGVRRVTVADATEVPRSFAWFREVADEALAGYAGVEADHAAGTVLAVGEPLARDRGGSAGTADCARAVIDGLVPMGAIQVIAKVLHRYSLRAAQPCSNTSLSLPPQAMTWAERTPSDPGAIDISALAFRA